MKYTIYMYMHTLDGKPAEFDGQDILFAGQTALLVPTIQQIHAERKRARKYRGKEKLSDNLVYGHQRVRAEGTISVQELIEQVEAWAKSIALTTEKAAD